MKKTIKRRPSEFSKAFGERVRCLRKGLKLTQKRLGKELGITAKHVGVIEGGKAILGGEALHRLRELSKCNGTWLLSGEEKHHGQAELVREATPEYPESDIKAGPFYERVSVNGYPGVWTLRPVEKLEKPPDGYKIVGVIIE